jgi:hypothetical protein
VGFVMLDAEPVAVARLDGAAVEAYTRSEFLDARALSRLLGAIPRDRVGGLRDYALSLGYVLTGRRNAEWRRSRGRFWFGRWRGGRRRCSRHLRRGGRGSWGLAIGRRQRRPLPNAAQSVGRTGPLDRFCRARERIGVWMSEVGLGSCLLGGHLCSLITLYDVIEDWSSFVRTDVRAGCCRFGCIPWGRESRSLRGGSFCDTMG